MHEVEVRYTEALARDAVRAFYWRTLSRAYGWLFVLVIPATLVVSLLLEGDRSWLVGALGALLLSLLAYLVAVYRAHYRNTVGAFRRLATPLGRFVFSDSGVSIASDAGTATLPWTAIERVWAFPEFWLFLMSSSSFFTFPIDGVGEDVLAFIRGKVRVT
jgi:hypothetical protein